MLATTDISNIPTWLGLLLILLFWGAVVFWLLRFLRNAKINSDKEERDARAYLAAQDNYNSEEDYK